MFDGLPSPRRPAPTPGRADEPAARLTVAGQLDLALSSTGQILEVETNGADLRPDGEAPFAGFMVRDHERGMTLWPATGRLEQSGRRWHLVSDLAELSLRLHASFIARADHIAVSGELRDYSGEDRAVSLYFAIPIRREQLAWWDDIDRRRPVQAHSEYGNWETVPAGANSLHSVYPFACVAGTGGLALGVPLDRPVLHRLGYNAPSQQFFLCFDFALTQATAKFPGRAPFRFVLYPVDPKWGFRSAADRYYGIYPELFTERTPQGALTSGTISEGTPPAAELGFAYNWSAARDAENVARTREHGLVPLLYNDSMRHYIFLSFPPDQTPSREQIAEDLEAFVNAPDPLRLYLERPEVVARLEQLGSIQGLTFDELATPEGAAYFRMLSEGVMRSAFHDAEGRLIPTYYNSAQFNHQHYGYNIHSARILCNPDPDIPGGYGQAVLDQVIGRRFAWMEAHGARLEGVSLDNYFVNAMDLDYRREHFAYADYPLTFASDRRPVILGDFCMYEFSQALAGRLRGSGGCLAANTGRMRFPFVAAWLDVNLFEWGMLEHQVIARTLAYHRPLVSLPIQPQHREDPWIKSAHLRMACFPGGGTSLLQNPEVMALYGRYMPALKKMAEAGWEPLTYASTGDTDVLIERFGAWQTGALCFSVVNRSQTEKPVEVRLDLKALGMTANGGRIVEVRDLVRRGEAVARVEADGQFGLTIAAGDTVAVEVVPAG